MCVVYIFCQLFFSFNLVVVLVVSDVIGVKRQMVTEKLSALCHQSSVINIYFSSPATFLPRSEEADLLRFHF